MKKFQVQFVIFNEKSVINGWKSAKDFPKMIFWIFINEDLQIGTDKDVADEKEEIVRLIYKNMESDRFDGLSNEMKNFISDNYQILLRTKTQDLDLVKKIEYALLRKEIFCVFDFLSLLVFKDGEYIIPFKKIRNFSDYSCNQVIQSLKKTIFFHNFNTEHEMNKNRNQFRSRNKIFIIIYLVSQLPL
jgi:hypothetical protein